MSEPMYTTTVEVSVGQEDDDISAPTIHDALSIAQNTADEAEQKADVIEAKVTSIERVKDND